MNNPSESKIMPNLSNINLCFGQSKPFNHKRYPSQIEKEPNRMSAQFAESKLLIGDQTSASNEFITQRNSNLYS